MKEFCQLQSPNLSKDSFGRVSRTWSTYLEGYFQVRSTGAGEILVGDQITEANTFQLIGRYDRRVRANHRILWHDADGVRYLEITKSVDLDARRLLLSIEATEQPAPIRVYNSLRYGPNEDDILLFGPTENTILLYA
jgi:head-tail adaptor